MNVHKMPANATRSRANCTRYERADTGGCRRSRRRLPADRSKWVDRYRREGWRIAGSLIPAASAAAADTPCGCRRDRAAAPAALDGQADRRRDRGLARHRQPCSAATGIEQAERVGAGRTGSRYGASIRANSSISISRSSAGSAPSAPHHRTISWPVNRHHGIGWSSSMSASTMPRASLSSRSWPTSARRAPSPSWRLPSLITPTWNPHRACDDDMLVLPIKDVPICLQRLDLRQIFTRPYTPMTNGKAERFIQTALREWAYACAYQNSDQRSAELAHWLHRYNWHRPMVA